MQDWEASSSRDFETSQAAAPQLCKSGGVCSHDSLLQLQDNNKLELFSICSGK